MKNCLKVLVVSMLFLVSTVFADTLVLTPLPPGDGLGLGCTLCDIPIAPKPTKPPKAIKAEPIQTVRPVEQTGRYVWYFASYGNFDYGSHGPYSTKEECETARQSVDRADLCFVQWRERFIE